MPHTFVCPHCMFGHPHMFGHLLYVWMPPDVSIPPYVWMPHLHTYHKESMLCQTKGVSISPIHLYTTLYVWTPPYVQMPPKCIGASINTGVIQRYEGCPNIWGHPNIQGWHPNIQGASKHMRGCPNIWRHPNIQGACKHREHIDTSSV